MEKLYAYDIKSNDFKFFENINAWKNQLTCNGIKRYLTYHLKKSLINDFEPAFIAYVEDYKKTNNGKGFFSLLRITFPYITFMGGLYKGKDETKNSIAFMEDYMGKINPLYKEISDLIYNIYRHGLIHNNMPKVSEIDGRYLSWVITFNDDTHLDVSVENNNVKLPISPNKLYLDLIDSIQTYINDFDNPSKSNELIENFVKGFREMSKIHTESELIDRRKCIKGVEYIRNI